MIWVRRGACGAGVGFPKAEPVILTIYANSEAASIGLGESSPRSGGRNSVKFIA